MYVKGQYYDYHEIKEHAGREFPFNIYPCSIPLDFKQVQVHWHEEMEIISIKKGRGLVTVDTVPHEVKEGEAVVVFPGQLHGIGQADREVMEYENIIFRTSMLMTSDEDVCTVEFLGPLSEGQVQSPIHIKEERENYGQITDCIRRMDILCRDKSYGYQLGVKGALFGLLCLLASDCLAANGERPRKSREKMKLILEYIETHYGERITVEDGAALCFYSNSHFMKYFKRYMGMPFTQYLNDFRLEKAGVLLRTTSMTVTAVAQRCGFDNISYFNRLFKGKYHMAPGEYRREMDRLSNETVEETLLLVPPGVNTSISGALCIRI